MKTKNLLMMIVVCSVILTACQSAGAPVTAEPTAGSNMEFDQMFIDMMVPHHQAAIEMALVALEKAEHPEIKQMAAQIIADQEKEIEQLKTWRQEWYGSDVTPPMSEMPMLPGMEDMDHGSMTMDMTMDIEKLRMTSESFDLMFIDLMTSHHQMAIDAAMMAEEQAIRDEVRDLADEIIDKQQAEIEQMKAWRLEWYGGTEPAATSTP
jgi:uncharacterized protein (DUF305 family)